MRERRIITGLARLVVVVALVLGGGAAGGARAQDGGNSTTTLPPLPDRPGIIPKPNSGTSPDDAGDRGGALQVGLFAGILGGVGVIGVLIYRESLRNRRDGPPAGDG